MRRRFDGVTWDADKSERCYAERGFDFQYATMLFEGPFVEWEDERRDYGEQRFVAVGEVAGRVIAIVWTPREELRRIISARVASRTERERFYVYRDTHEQADS